LPAAAPQFGAIPAILWAHSPGILAPLAGKTEVPMIQRLIPAAVVAALLAAALTATAATPRPLHKPATPRQQTEAALDHLRSERDRRLDAAQEDFQDTVEDAARQRDALVTEARQRHDREVIETRAWYDLQRRALEREKTAETASAAD
jgi:hypothetical protein